MEIKSARRSYLPWKQAFFTMETSANKAFVVETFCTVHSCASMLNNICSESMSAARMCLYSINECMLDKVV